MQKFRKCKCENIDYGTYENQVLLKIPLGLDIRYNDPEKMLRTSVSVDACLAKEIQFLWSEGIKTTGCCCNHNKETHHPFIGVTHDCIEKMKSFGYINAPNHLDNTREDEFYPKTLLIQTK